MQKLTGIVVLAVVAGFVPVQVSGANLLRSDWVGCELHLVDRDTGASNSNLYWRVPNAVLKEVRGKALYFGGRVKQVDASGISAVSLYIAAHSKDGKARRESVSATGVRGATPWLALRAKVQVPADAESLRLAIRCAHGFWQTGEATFKDLARTTDPAELPPIVLPPPDVLGHAACPLPDPHDTPEYAAYRATYRDMKPFEEDGRARPEIKNGTWYFNGRPTFFLGAWIYPRSIIDWGPGRNPLGIDHVAYNTPPGRELFAALGFNSSQISAAPSRPGEVLRGLPERKLRRLGKPSNWKEDERDMAEYFARFGDVPMVMDFAFGYNKQYPPDLSRTLNQYMDAWHAFVPFCPEHPEGWAYYRDYFLAGTRVALKNGLNAFLYELFNESSYNCQCPWNRRAFLDEARTRYGTIAAANATWGTDFDSFDEMVFAGDWAAYPGVWYDWCMFTARRYAAVLKRGRETVRQVDRRRNVYFTEQASGTPPAHPGMDYRLVADALDVLTVEGGWQYGFKTEFNAKDAMEEVVATGGSKHYFNLAFFRALAKDAKPISNNEHYCTRFENGLRVPSKKTDYITSLWLEVMHGVSSDFTYVLDKRHYEARTMEQAYANVAKPSYKSSSLLNPFNVKPEDLDAFKVFRTELAPYEEKLLPMPRVRPATVAVYYSYPSMIQARHLSPGKKQKDAEFVQMTTAWYTGLLHRHYPLRVVFDKDVARLGDEVQALVFPGGCAAVPPQVVRAAEAFARRGGLVLAAEGTLAYDEYLKPLAEPPAFTRVASPDAAADELERRKVRRYAQLVAADDPGRSRSRSSATLPASDVQVIDRGDFKFVCCVNMGDRTTRHATLRIFTPESAGTFRVTDPLSKREIGTFTVEELAAGIPIDLPSQERVLRVLERASAGGRDLREDFRSPQGAARENTGPLFWMHGTETPERLREYVGRVDESGQGILTIESRPHVDWMRDGWWRDVDIVLGECKKRGLKMMVFDDYWWPSQGMGGKYPIPEQFQCRDVKGTVYWSYEVPKKAENEVARIVVKEIEKGVFKPGPDGDKTIVYTWFTSNGSYRFPTVNGLDEAAVDWFIANYYQPYYDRYAKEFKDGTIPGFFFDEPQFRSWWGPALAQELAARGDDAGELLTALKFKLADADDQARALYRYLDARAEVWGRTIYGRQSDWCRKHGVYSSGHFLEHANDHYSPVLAGGNVMQQMKYVEVPGVDLVCRQYYPNQRESEKHQVFFGQMPKYASSTAHVYNRHGGMNWCEIFGAYGQDITYPQMKWLCDWHQYQGCYYLIPHSFNPKSPHDKDCPPYFYNGGFEPRYPLFRVWADYNNRCALLLSGGDHVCHIAQCIPGISYHVGKTIRPEMFAFAIQDAQFDSDWMGYDAVEGAVVVKPSVGEGRAPARPYLRTENGTEHYDILTLPATEYVPFAVLEKALAFAKAGGVVVGYGIKPCGTPTRGKTSADVEEIVDAIFAQPTALFLDGEPNGAQLRAALAKNYPGTDKPLAVRTFDFPGLSAADGRMLAVNHYVKDGAQTLFIANQDFSRRRDLMVRAEWTAEKAELWDPMQGTIEKPVVENGLIKLALEPSQAVFLVWPAAGSDKTLPRVDKPEGKVLAVDVKETVTRMVAGGTNEPAAVSLDYAKWIWHPVNPRAQGKVTFRAKIDAAAEQKATITFSCDNAAIVRVNGKQVAEQKAGDAPGYSGWRMPTTATFALKAGANDIEVLAENAIPGLAGFVASVKWPSGHLLTDGQAWSVSRKGETPVQPLEICRYGQGAWKRLGPAGRVTRSPFNESVATSLSFKLPDIQSGERVYFVCDDVEGEKSAAVTVNGAYAGGFIGAPYRLDITRAVKAGANALEAKPFRLKNPRVVIVR